MFRCWSSNHQRKHTHKKHKDTESLFAHVEFQIDEERLGRLKKGYAGRVENPR